MSQWLLRTAQVASKELRWESSPWARAFGRATFYQDDRPHAPLNVQGRDDALIVVSGPLDDGALAARNLAQQPGKPRFGVPLDGSVLADTITSALTWLRSHDVAILHVAGPRESGFPGLHQQTFALLEAMNLAMDTA